MKLALRLLIAGFAGSIPASVAHGQDADVPPLDCAAAQVDVSSRRNANEYSHGLGLLISCPDAGPIGIASEWSSPPTDTVMLRSLSGFSRYLRDRRVFDALALASRTSPRRGVRLAAIAALVEQFDPHIAVVFRTPEREDATPREYVMLGFVSHEVIPNRSAQPVSATEARARVLSTLREVAALDKDPRVAGIAGHLAGRLEKRGYPPRQ